MFHSCLSFLLTEINAYIKARTDVKEAMAHFVSPQSLRSLPETPHDNKIIMSLVDLHREEVSNSQQEYIPQGNSFIAKKPPIILSLRVLFAAHFHSDQSIEGLKYLALVIAFFQSKRFFSPKDTPILQELQLNSLAVDLVNLESAAQDALWNRLRAPYMPSVLYKVSNLAIEDTHAIGARIPGVKDIVI